MDRAAFYRVRSPIRWAGPPERFSFTSLRALDRCPRRWQLLHSEYDGLPRYPERPQEAAAVGTIVHLLLGRLLRALATAHHPAPGSDAFRLVISRVNVLTQAEEQLAGLRLRFQDNPRAGGAVLHATPRAVYNLVSQAFQSVMAGESAPSVVEVEPFERLTVLDETEWPQDALASRLGLLLAAGLLSEERVRHPSLPLDGTIDLLERRDGKTVVADFKIGTEQPEHREQVTLYALLWWRRTGHLPSLVEVRYGAKVESWSVSAAELEALESRLAMQIGQLAAMLRHPHAPARIGAHCTWCGVRALCEPYWSDSAAFSAGPWADLEVEVVAPPQSSVVMGRDRAGREITLTGSEDVLRGWTPFQPGEWLRVLGVRREGPAVFQLVRTSEVFRVPADIKAS